MMSCDCYAITEPPLLISKRNVVSMIPINAEIHIGGNEIFNLEKRRNAFFASSPIVT